ncbi:MAG: type II toxin-antitoxin system RelE/ParE family toxin [Clostridiales bacterium]|jgi:toxin ParE1/3/4|nr:type II toxin-antitoxin system RelE/ParE family toxin [Clostridiales bacterium]
MEYTIQYLPQAVRNIQEIKNYISQDNPTAAKNLTDLMKARIEALRTMPKKHEEYPDNPAFRKVVVGSYLIFYKVNDEEKTVKIRRVIHGKQDIKEIIGRIK